MYISVFTAEMYFQETRQKLDTEVASHIASDNKCFRGDSVNVDVLKNVFHNVMVINPSIEVYLLDTTGKILTYYAPNQIINIKSVPLDPIKKFIVDHENRFLLGIDPKNPHKEKAFSAAKVVEEGKFKGYIYVILGGEEFDNASQLVFGSYILRLGVRSMIFALIAAAIIGFLAIGIITKNIRKIIDVIRKFQRGKLDERIILKGKGELSEFSHAFNEMADTIVKNIEEIKQADTLRRELVANVSHDLRTPLSIIRGYVETILIKENILSIEERKKYLETILSSTDRLLKLVEELFELSKLEAKDKTPNFEEFSIAELIQDIHMKNDMLAKKRNIELKCELDENLPYVNADIAMMEKALQNLIDNAFKFTKDSGKIILGAKLENKKILVYVCDNGIGISEQNICHIFEKYYQIKRVADSGNKGTGLGLAIVKKIVDLHNFNISVKSNLNEGTTFYIEINT